MKRSIVSVLVLLALAAVAFVAMDGRKAESNSGMSEASRNEEGSEPVSPSVAQQKGVSDLPRLDVREIGIAPNQMTGQLREYRRKFESRLESFLGLLSAEKQEAVLSVLYDAQENWMAFWSDWDDLLDRVLEDQEKLQEAERQFDEIAQQYEDDVHARLREVLTEEEYRRFDDWWPSIGIFAQYRILEPR